MGVGLTDYRAALDFLVARTTGKDRLGLERTQAVLRALGDPHVALRTFHVAGTNGKGSVVATLEALLSARGLRVGKYTSPHLVDFRERILIDGEPVSEAALVEFVERWTPEIVRIGASFFEATTGFAFQALAAAQVDVAIIEVGLGGRLDSTNVITPLVAGVTSIGLDHQEFLGETKEEIAGEKAGIFKRGVPAAIGELDPAIRALLARHAHALGASAVRVMADDCRVEGIEVDHTGTGFSLANARGETARLHTPLAGRHQAHNAALALTMLDAAGDDWRVPLDEAAVSLRGVRLPGRFQEHGKFIFDVAHNADGMAVLGQTLDAVAPRKPVVALFNVLTDKDWRSMMTTLAPCVQHFVLTLAPTSPDSRAWDPAVAHAFAVAHGWAATLERDFGRALALADRLGSTVLVTGSFHTVGDAMLRLRVNPLAR